MIKNLIRTALIGLSMIFVSVTVTLTPKYSLLWIGSLRGHQHLTFLQLTTVILKLAAWMSKFHRAKAH